MSRIGNKIVEVPSGVTVSVKSGSVAVKGPKGSLTQSIVDGISVSVDGGKISVGRSGDTPQARANHGLIRALVANMVTGVSKGFEKKLEIVGVGYKAEVKGKKAIFHLGYSHPIDFPFPDGITIGVEKNVEVMVRGVDKCQVGQVASIIRGFRPPDSYKGKGVRYAGERVRLKAGKSGQ
jgi:large subunit ribosomal protein L6